MVAYQKGGLASVLERIRRVMRGGGGVVRMKEALNDVATSDLG